MDNSHIENTEEALRESDARYRSLYNRTPAMLHSIDPDGIIVSVSDRWLNELGYDREEVVGHHLTDFMTEESRKDALEKYLPEFFKCGHCDSVPYCFDRKGGGEMLVSLSATAEKDHLGRITRTLAVCEDITERQQVMDALRESEARVRAILETTVDAIITIDEKGIILSYNKAAGRIFGYDPPEVIGRNVSLLMPEPYREEHDAYIKNYLETGYKKIIGIGREVYGARKNGTTFPLEIAVSEVRLKDGVTFTGIVRDISDRRRLEQEILRISDEERRRIGQDLHDGLGQMLTGIGLISQSLGRVMKSEENTKVDEVLEITTLVREADQFARSLARGLVPVDVDEKGLSTALARLTKNAERLFGINCIFEEVGTRIKSEASIAIHLYRIAQEAVSNAAKHGKAQRVRVMLVGAEDYLKLRIQDNGIGFPEKLEEDHGMGVRIMQYRARMINADLEIRRGPINGTIVTCSLNPRGRRQRTDPQATGVDQ